jgi:hypothetical protein
VDSGNALDVTSRYESMVVQELSKQYKSFTETAKKKSLEMEFVDIDKVFLNAGSCRESQRVLSGWGSSGSALKIDSTSLHGENGEEKHVFFQHESMRLSIVLDVKVPVEDPGLYIKIRRTDGVLMTSWYSQIPYYYSLGDLKEGRHALNIVFKDLLFGDGIYLVSVLVYPKHQKDKPLKQAYAIEENRLCFEVKREIPLSAVFDHPLEVYSNDAQVTARKNRD